MNIDIERPETTGQRSRPLLDLRAVVVLVLGMVAGGLAYRSGGWPAAIPGGVAVIGLLFVILPH
jgi:hypothetical protein